MKLFLLRHAKAAEATDGSKDAERKLTPKGKTDAFRRARRFRKKLAGVEFILTSPYPRAAETAEIFASVLKKNDVLAADEMFAATARAEDILRHLRNFSRYNELMLVGHEPSMTSLASLLISGTTQCQIRLKKPGIIVIDVEVLSPRGGVLTGLR